ncbi:MAG: hypothetical protein NC419_11125 [Muribaculaceae bacterium]|nr:hypothetical protein [Muribaculaceae bacterium]
MEKRSTKLQALQDILEENGISAETIERSDALIEKIKKYADAVPDYCHPSYTRHLPGDIITITFLQCWEMPMNGKRSKLLQGKVA